MTISRPASNGTQQPRLCLGPTANQLDRADFFRRIIPSALFFAPFARLVYKYRSVTGPAVLSETAGSSLWALAVSIIYNMAPRYTKIPTRVRGKTSLLSQCAFHYVFFAISIAVLICTDKNRTWSRASRETFTKANVADISSKRAETLAKVSEHLPTKAVEIWLDKICILLPFFAMLGCGAYNSLMGIVLRFEANRLGLDHPTEAQVRAHREKNRRANAQNVATDFHGRRPVALAEAELTNNEMREWTGNAHITYITATLAVLVNGALLLAMLPRVLDIGRDDFDQRSYHAQKIWIVFYHTPSVTVPFFATLAVLLVGGPTRVKQLWSYNEQWDLDEQGNCALHDLACHGKMLATGGQSPAHAGAADATEGAEVEAFLVAEKLE